VFAITFFIEILKGAAALRRLFCVNDVYHILIFLMTSVIIFNITEGTFSTLWKIVSYGIIQTGIKKAYRAGSRDAMIKDQRNQVNLYNRMIKIQEFISGELTKIHFIAFVSYFTILSALEIAAYAGINKVITVIASRIWLTGGFLSMMILLYFFVSAFIMDIKKINIIPLISMAGVLVYLFYLCSNMKLSDINPDAAQQVAAGLDAVASPDLTYTGKAFLGYPARQYVLIAYPALLFGRSITTMHLGFALAFAIGIASMYSGLRQWMAKKNLNGIYAVITIYALFAFRYVTEYYKDFEQSILPISITMILMGLFLNLLLKPNALGIFAISWFGCLCSNCYTPTLATLGLLLVFLLLLVMVLVLVPNKMPFPVDNQIETAKIIYAAYLNILIFFFATLIGGREDKVTQLRENINYGSLVRNSIVDFIMDRNAVFLGFMGAFVILYLLAALTWRLHLYDFLLALWTLSVFVATYLFTGYTDYTAAWIMQRALIVIPVLLTGMMLSLCELISKYQLKFRNSSLLIGIIAFVLIGRYNFMQINQSNLYINNIQPMKYLLSDLDTTTDELKISHTEPFNFVLYSESILMHNPADYFKFLYPEAIVYIGTYEKFPEDLDLSLPTLVYSDMDITDMVKANEVDYFLYEDERYSLTGLWFKACILP